MTEASPKPLEPAALGRAGKALWHSVTSRWELDPDEAELVAQACSVAERIPPHPRGLEHGVALGHVTMLSDPGPPAALIMANWGPDRPRRPHFAMINTGLGQVDAHVCTGVRPAPSTPTSIRTVVASKWAVASSVRLTAASARTRRRVRMASAGSSS